MATPTTHMKPASRFATIFIGTQSGIWILVALFLVIDPAAIVWALFADRLTAAATVVARLFGAELTGLALSSWVTRGIANTDRARQLFACYFTCNTLGFLVSVSALSNLTSFGSSIVGLYLLYAAGFAILWIREK